MALRRSDPVARNRVMAVPATSTWESPGGAAVAIRPTRLDDTSIAQDFVPELSAEPRHYRFMRAVRELTPQMLRIGASGGGLSIRRVSLALLPTSRPERAH